MKTPWRGKSVLITSGPTREHLDPIRFLTNASSGRMGFALAAEAARRGARVAVVSGPTELRPPAGVAVTHVVTGIEMYRKTLALARRADVVIGAAAVSDWRFSVARAHKLKRGPGELRLTLKPNPDIIKAVAVRRRRGQIVVGFALETRSMEENARAKLRRKGLDLVVANGPGSLSGGRTKGVIVRKDGTRRVVKDASKSDTARLLLGEIENLWREKN